MQYLVTGGTGFIGAYVVRALLDAGHDVTLFDIAPDRQFLRDVTGVDEGSVQIIPGDVTDPFALLRAMRECKARRVVHLAATLSGLSDQNPLRALRVNCEGTLNVFEASLACDVEKVVWASTIGVFGTPGVSGGDDTDGDAPIDNDAAHSPVGIYGACKSFNERMAANYARNRGLRATGLRFAFTYGYGKALTIARGTRVGFMADLIDKPALGQASVVSYGDAVMDWVYASDAARAVLLASETPETKSVALNVCGERRSVRDVAKSVQKLLPNTRLEVKSGAWGRNLNYDPSAAQRQIGYSPRVGIEDGLRLNIDMLRVKNGLSPL